jgi:rod shape-determining protein MreC
MRSLLLFIGKYHAFFLFLLLEAVSITIIVQHNWFQQSHFANTSNQVVGTGFAARSWLLEYFSLRSENKRLSEENARLKTLVEGTEEMNPRFNYDTTNIRFEGLTYIVKDTIKRKYKTNDTLPERDTIYIRERRPKFEFEAARVVNSTTNNDENYLTINKGSAQGIIQDMAVISNHGLVGLVSNVSLNFASIIPIIHLKFAISAKIKVNDYPGTVVWQGGDPHFATMKYVPKHAAAFIQIGDTVITRGSLLFPENIPIGTIHSSTSKDGDNYANITVLISTDYTTINHVYVMRNKLQNEQRELEMANPKTKAK